MSSKRRRPRVAAALIALLGWALPATAHALVECDVRAGDSEVVDECRVTSVSAAEALVLESKPRHTLLVWMDGPSKLDLESLANVPWIEQLTLYDTTMLGGTKTKLEDLSALRVLGKLRRLVIAFESVTDLDFVASLKNLEVLDVASVRVKKDISPLGTLDKLRDLRITVAGAQAKALGQMTKLERLDVAGIDSLDVLAKLSKLTSLHVAMSSSGASKSSVGLSAMTAMRSLRIRCFDLADLVGTKGMAQLEALDVSGTKVADLSPLAGATRLRTLDVQGTKVSSLAALTKISTLEVVDVRDTTVVDFSPLMASAKSLRHLYVPASTPKSATAPLRKANPKLVVSTP